MMQRFWSWLAVELGQRAGLVAVIGLLVTLVLGLGITQLEFATGQDSYLNKSDQVYKDNVAYQDLFGGQAMLDSSRWTRATRSTSCSTPTASPSGSRCTTT